MESNVLVALLLITGLAALIPVLSKRLDHLGIPTVVYEIVAGIIVGGSGFNLIEPSPILNFLAEFGFAFLMFLSGLELDLRLLNPRRPTADNENRWTRALPLGVAIFISTIVLAFIASSFLAPPGATSNPFLLGLILSTTSLGVVVPVLKERDLTGNHFGQYILVAASIADFATLILLTTDIAILSRGLTLDLLLIPTLLLIFILVARLTMRASRAGRISRALSNISSATSQVRVRGAIALMVAWVVLAEAFGVELILGAFLAGAIGGLLTSDGDHGEQEKLDAIGYGFFIPIFFIMVGARFNLEAIVSSTEGLILLLWLVGVAFAVKLGPALLLKLRFPWRKVLAGGMLLSPRLSLIIAASAIALDMGLISETVNSDVIMLAIITVAVAPFLFNRIFPYEEKLVRSGVILVGQDQLAEYIVERLQHGDETVTVICPEQSQLETFRGLGAQVVDGCVGVDQALDKAGAGKARVLLDLTPDSSETLEVCRLGKGKYDIPLVVSRISDVDLIPKLQEMGVKIIHPELATAMALEGAIRYPSAFDVLAHQAKDIEVAEIKVTNSQYSGSSLAEISLPGDVIVLSLQRNSTVMIPHGDTILEHNDLLGLIGHPDSVEEATAMLKG